MKKNLHIFSCFILLSFCRLSGQTVNIGFESTLPGVYTNSNSVSGWTLSSQTVTNHCSTVNWLSGSSEFSVISTPYYDPVIGNLLTSPLGGSNVAKLNNNIGNSYTTRLARSHYVTNSSSVFQFAYACVLEAQQDNFCDHSRANLLIKDQSGTILTCLSLTFAVSYTGMTFTVNSAGTYWSNWQIKTIDLSPFMNSTVTIEVVSADCVQNTHYGTFFFDGTFLPAIPAVNFCAGSNQATITGPLGYSAYQWYSPISGTIAPPQGTMSTLNVSNPFPGSVYTLQVANNVGCVFQYTYALFYTTTSITSVSTKSTCVNGTSGSASVQATGSGTGYTYTWTNTSNSVVGTSSVINNIPPGTYTIRVAGFASPGCGTYSTIATVATGTPGLTTLIQPFCGNEAYLAVPNGTNHQWYDNSLASISASLGGTASSYTTSPLNLSNITVGYQENGCRDSVKFILFSSAPGVFTLTSNPIICPSATNGLAILSLTPMAGSPSGLNSYSVFSTGTTSAYNATLFPTSLNTFTATGLSAGGTYSVKAFDGSCKYALNFSVTPYIVNYTVTPSTATICSGNSAVAALSFTAPPSPTQYSYSWSPSTFVISNTVMNTIITPTLAPGPPLTLIYTVVVTPSLINCPSSRTIAITVANPVTPNITAIPQLCSNGSFYTVTANPPSGTFINSSSSSIGTTNGILNPMLSTVGINSFSYAAGTGTCIASSSGSYLVNAPPSLTISGNSTLCEGQSTTLLANGADSYNWINFTANPLITVTPLTTTNYTVQGTNLTTNCIKSEIVTVVVIAHPTPAISGNTIICLGESATLTANGANSYLWSNGSSSSSIIVSPNTSSSYSVTGTSVLASCSGTQAVNVIVNACNLVGIPNQNNDEIFRIYPNPTSGKFSFETLSKISITITDQLGRTILEQNFEKGNYALDLNNYPEGIYFVKTLYKDQIKVARLIKKN